MKNYFRNTVYSSVVSNGFCIGCGLCVSLCPSNLLVMKENSFGENEAFQSKDCNLKCGLCLKVCPFSNEQLQNEYSIGKEIFGKQKKINESKTMGFFLSTFCGFTLNLPNREKSASGGLCSAVIEELFLAGAIDAAIVPIPTAERPWYKMEVIDDIVKLDLSRGSIYHLLDYSKILKKILSDKKDIRYAITALPCVAKSIRLAQIFNSKLKHRLVYILGLTCGGGKSLKLPDILTSLCNKPIGEIRYRSKLNSKKANEFSFLTSKTNQQIFFSGLYGFLFLNRFAEYKSCLVCDDVFAELADVSFMDAWLPEYVLDRRGTNFVIVRNIVIHEFLILLLKNKKISINYFDFRKIVKSQEGALKKKRMAISDRVALFAKYGYVPKKRAFLEFCEPIGKNTALAKREILVFNKLHKLSSKINFEHLNFIKAFEVCFRVGLIYFFSFFRPRRIRSLVNLKNLNLLINFLNKKKL